jgi:hypothetical protein
MYLAGAVFTQPEKLDHEPLLPFFHFPALTSHDPLTFFKVGFHRRGKNREIPNMSLTNHNYALDDDMCKIRIESPDAELWVVGKTFWTLYTFERKTFRKCFQIDRLQSQV